MKLTISKEECSNRMETITPMKSRTEMKIVREDLSVVLVAINEQLADYFCEMSTKT